MGAVLTFRSHHSSAIQDQVAMIAAVRQTRGTQGPWERGPMMTIRLVFRRYLSFSTLVCMKIQTVFAYSNFI